MRSLLLIFSTLFLCLTVQNVWAQVYSLNSALNGQTITTCSGTFYDSGTAGQYAANENNTVTFCPATPGTRMKLLFESMDIAFGDSVVVYDGPNTSSPVLIIYNTANSVTGSIVAQNSGGCLTVAFNSDASTQGGGWKATIKCALPCQPIVGNITSTPAADANGVVTVCLNQPFTLTANVNYPNSGDFYTQRNDLNNFKWRLGFANDTSGIGLTSLTKTITQPAGYKVKLTVSDSNGCFNIQEIFIKVRVPVKPTFSVIGGSTVCLGDTATLTASATSNTGYYIPPPFSGDSLFLPDGVGVTYTDTLKIIDFAPGQKLNNVNDFLGVFLNMEHSWLDDLELKLIAPNGNTIILKQANGGVGCDLGEPVEERGACNLPGALSVPGVGYEYGFTPNPSYGTMVATSTLYRHNYVNKMGCNMTNAPYLPAGNYTPFNNFTNLIGTPLNGNWVISVRDDFIADNGFLFNWHLKFATSLYPNPEQYTIPVQSVLWQPAPTIVSNSGNTIKVSSTAAGTFSYTTTSNDGFCSFDTTVNITVTAKPTKPNLGVDIAICAGQNTNLFIFNRDPSYTYTWSTGVTANQITINQPGLYWVEAKNALGCTNRDTIIVNPSSNIRINLGADTMFCATAPYVLQPQLTGTFNNLQWQNGSTAATFTINAPGIYWLQGISSEGCIVRDSIVVTNNPLNDWQMPNDTSVCGNDYTITIINTLTGAPHPELYTWWDGTTGYTHLVTDSGNYKLTVNFGGCIKTDSMIVDLNKIPLVNLGNDTMYCASAPNVLKSTSLNTSDVTYLWNNGTTNATLPINATGLYWLEVATANGCKARDSINISNNQVNDWQMPNDTIACGNNYSINITNTSPVSSFIWFDGSTGLTKLVTDSGMYKATANYAGCFKLDSTLVKLNKVPLVSLGNDTMLCASSPFVIQPNITGTTVTSHLWSNGSSNTSLPINNSGIYWLEVSTPLGCKARDSVEITNNPVNNWQMPNDTAVCGDNYLLTITNTVLNPAQPSMFTWFDGSIGLSHNITDSGMYKATATYLGCARIDSTLVEINRIPKVSLGNDTMLCATAPFILNPDTTGTIVSYGWNTGFFGFDHPINSAGTYWLEVSSPLACTARDSIVIIDNPVNNWQMPSDTILCGDNYLISITNTSPASTFIWSDGSTGLTKVVTDSGMYKATANYQGCTRTDSTLVRLNKIPTVSLGNDTMLCASSPFLLQPDSTGKITSYTWSNGFFGFDLPVNNAGTYWLQVSSPLGCTTRDSIIITDNPVNSWQMPNDTILCGDSYLISITNTSPASTFIWSDGSIGLTKVVIDSGMYKATANYQGCTRTDSTLVKLNKIPAVSLGNDTMLCASSPFTLRPDSTGKISSYTWSNGFFGFNLPVNNAGIYWLQVSSPLGCTATDSIEIINNPVNNWQMPIDTTICGNSYLISITNTSPASTFIWSDGSTGLTKVVTDSGMYKATANYQGCTKVDSTLVRLNKIPTVDLGNDTLFCATAPYNLQSQVTTVHALSYVWNNGSANTNLPINNTGIYWLEVATPLGCKARDSININANPVNDWQMPNDTTICGNSYLINISNTSPASSFTWFDGSTGLSKLIIDSGKYKATANYIGCTKTDSIIVALNKVPIVDLGIDTLFCAASPNVLQSKVTGGTVTAYLWSDGSANTSLPINKTGLYWLEVSTPVGCKTRDSIVVDENPINNWQMQDDTTICDRSTYNLVLQNYPSSTTFVWSDGPTTSFRAIMKPGTYKLTANFIGCIKQDSIGIGIRPLPVINAGRDTTLCSGLSLPLHVSYPGASYVWSTGRTDSSFIATQQGIYWAKATLNGCSYTDSITLSYMDCSCNTQVPNAFSPNNDGINDVLKVKIDCYPTNYQLRVFNRNGQQVYTSKEYSKGWDGTMNGSKLPVGTYYYIITYFNQSLNRTDKFTGSITLLR